MIRSSSVSGLLGLLPSSAEEQSPLINVPLCADSPLIYAKTFQWLVCFFLLLPIPQIQLQVYGALYVKQLRVDTIENTVYVTQTEAFSKTDAVLQGEN